jgi:maleate cis-trans isomerase
MSRFLQDSNYGVDSFETFVEQGVIASQEEVDARNYDFTDDEVKASVRRTRALAPKADAVVIGGSGVRTLHWIDDLEQELGIPLVSADRSLYHSVMRQLALDPKSR